MRTIEDIREYNRKYEARKRERNIEQVRDYMREWREKHPGYMTEYFKSKPPVYNSEKARKAYLLKTEWARLRAIDL